MYMQFCVLFEENGLDTLTKGEIMRVTYYSVTCFRQLTGSWFTQLVYV